MKEVKVYPIGTKVFYFSPSWQGELEIKESVVIGCFMHKSKGELHYNLIKESVEAYAVRLTREECEHQLAKFLDLREKLYEANRQHNERLDELWGDDIHPEYSIDNLGGEDDE